MKGLALFSGGLDSTLAIRIVQEQGVEVVALHFSGPFTCGEPPDGLGKIESLADQLAVKLIVHQLGQEFLDLVMSPKFGYGKGLNPCIDCRIYELQSARQYMETEGASFLITGEVVGQRPMSQRQPVLYQIEREAGVPGLVLRPLSAQRLPDTIPERMGWVDRTKLPGIQGRSRKQQLQLAEQYGITGYSTPAGGCLLTSKEFTRKAEDLIDHGGKLTVRNVELLRGGRLFRINEQTRAVVGRNQAENRALMELAADDVILRTVSVPGPTALVIDNPSQSAVEISAAIVARYSDHHDSEPVEIEVTKQGETRSITAVSLDPDTIEQLRI